jgi:transketolase
MNPELKKLDQQDYENLQSESIQARSAILHMTTLANSGHPGGSMSTIDYLLTLYKKINVNQNNANNPERDRVIISNGHISPAVYSTLALNGFFNIDEAISQFRLAGSIYEGHIETDVNGVELGTGNLGQGLSAATGFALGCRINRIQNRIFVIMGDGENQKGQISEARRFAIKYKLTNITAFIDYNRLQIGGNIDNIMPNNIKADYLADGWEVIEINGHSFMEISEALDKADSIDKPVLILGNTIMGKGVSFMENKEKFHGSTLSEEDLSKALEELQVENKLNFYKKLRDKFSPLKNKYKQKYKIDINPGNARIYDSKTDNRSAWGNALAEIAEINKNAKTKIAVWDCDLAGSVKTNSFQKIMPENFIESGIMEHHTATAGGSMSMENIQVFWAEFGVFGVDEVYNQLRLNDINNTNFKVITTHVGLDVGEDGKTHQCIDYIGIMKNLYHFKVIVPACPNQTDRVTRYIASQPGNFFVAMGRSKLDIIKDENDNIYFGENYSFEYGKADILRKGNDASLLVSGTLAGNAVKISDKLRNEGINLRVVNFSCLTDIDIEAIKSASATGHIFTYEDHNINTGLGNTIANVMLENGIFCKFNKFGVEDYAMSGKSSDVYKLCRLDIESVYHRIKSLIK